MNLAETAAATDLSTLIGNFTSQAGTQFGAAAPGVITAAAGIALILWGVPKLIGLFKRAAK